jgi:TolA-binding protein
VSAEYSRQVSAASVRVAQAEEGLAAAEDRIFQLESVIREQGLTQASRLENIDQVNAEVVRLRGMLEVLQFQVDGLRAEQETYLIDQERRQLYDEARLNQLEAFLGIDSPDRPTIVGEETAVSVPGDESSSVFDAPDEPEALEEVPADAAGKLQLAAQHMEEGRQAVARAILERAIDDHPSDPMLDEIRYRIGETWFNEENWGDAILAFGKVTLHHPDSGWAPWAMLRQGEGFEARGQADGARIYYEGLINNYPRSDAAKDARTRLGP